MEKKFVYLEIDDKSSELLRYWCSINKFNLALNFDQTPIPEDQFKFHLTIFFTENEISHTNGRFFIDPIELIPDRFEALGENRDVPVMKFKKTLDLLLIRKSFENKGFVDKWSEWKPHISLSYERKKYNLDKLVLPKFPIITKTIIIEKQSE